MKKYKINYLINDTTLSTLYVHSIDTPKIPDFDNNKYFVDELVMSEESELNIINVKLKELIKKTTLEVFYNNKLIGDLVIVENNAINKVHLECDFFDQKHLVEQLNYKDSKFSGVVPSVGCEVEYLVNKEQTRLFISDVPLSFEHASGHVVVGSDGKLTGLIADEGYYIAKLELGDNNEIICDIRPNMYEHKKQVLSSIASEFSNEEFEKTNKLLINELLDSGKDKIASKNLDYFKSQTGVKESKATKVQNVVSEEQTYTQIADLIENVINEEKTETKDYKVEKKVNEEEVGIIKKLLSKFKF